MALRVSIDRPASPWVNHPSNPTVHKGNPVNREIRDFCFWGCLLILSVSTSYGLIDRFMFGKRIPPMDGLAAGGGGIFLMFLHAAMESNDDLDDLDEV